MRTPFFTTNYTNYTNYFFAAMASHAERQATNFVKF